MPGPVSDSYEGPDDNPIEIPAWAKTLVNANREGLKEGWFWPENSRKAHYMRECRSLCGKWGCFSYNLLEAGTYADSDSCKECSRKLQAADRRLIDRMKTDLHVKRIDDFPTE